jgi:hypothetical protein
MATNDALVASFWTKYHYNRWRPETAILEGNLDDNAKTDAEQSFVPYILTPCFPTYPSNHGSGSNSAAEILNRVYGASGHAITMANPSVPGLTFHYTRFNQITDDISDARTTEASIFVSIRRQAPIWDATSGRLSTNTTSAARGIPTAATKATTTTSTMAARIVAIEDEGANRTIISTRLVKR